MKRILPVLLAALLLAACGESAAVSSAPSRAPSVSAPPASVPAVSSQSVSQPAPEPQPGPSLPQDWETLSAEQTADLFTALGAEDGRTGWRLADDAAWTKDDGFAYPVTTFEKGEAGWSVTTFSVFGSGARRRVVDTVLWDGANTYYLLFSKTIEEMVTTVYEEDARPWCRLALAEGGERMTLNHTCPGLVCRPEEGDELTVHAALMPPEQEEEARRQADEWGRAALEDGGYLLVARTGEAQQYVFGRQGDFLAQAQALDGEAAP